MIQNVKCINKGKESESSLEGLGESCRWGKHTGAGPLHRRVLGVPLTLWLVPGFSASALMKFGSNKCVVEDFLYTVRYLGTSLASTYERPVPPPL